MTAADAEAAIAAANAAWPAWKAKTAKERSIILRKWFDLLMANQDDLGRLMTAEQGKPFAEAKGEIAWRQLRGMVCRGSQARQRRNPAPVRQQPPPDGLEAAHRRMRGHHALELPLAMITRKVAPALAAGCPVVIIKPAELTR